MSQTNRLEYIHTQNLIFGYPDFEKSDPSSAFLTSFDFVRSNENFIAKWPNYQVNGQCRYGNHCQFAHGLTDLKPADHHPRYKTSL